MALRNGILNKNALIAPLKQSIIKAITPPPPGALGGGGGGLPPGGGGGGGQ